MFETLLNMIVLVLIIIAIVYLCYYLKNHHNVLTDYLDDLKQKIEKLLDTKK